MDIDLLSKMVKELILDNDEVSLPGVGSFVAELVPSSFSDKGYTINPPYKRLSFRKKADASDNVLIDFYAKSNNVDKETASKIVIDFLSEMQKVLELRKSIVFPGLGKLRATKENIFFFVADEDLDIYPEGFGLEPISLKTHEETPAEVSATIAALQDILNPEETESQFGSGEQPEAESDSELQPEQQATVEESDHQSENESQSEAEGEQENEPQQEPEPDNEPDVPVEQNNSNEPEQPRTEPAKKSRKGWKALIWTAVAIVALAVTFIVGFVILAHIAPDFIDSILYTQEELEIINH